MTIYIIKDACVYSPDSLGKQDIAFTQNKILHIGNINETALSDANLPLEVIDGGSSIVTPGFVDPLVHITGGGGEGGFHTRTPQMQVSDAVKHGVTTLVAALGTDAITRSLEDVIAKAKSLKYYGLSSYIYSGNYHVPIKTITGDLTKDIMMIEEVIGVGEVAIADHRGSQVSCHELSRIASQARVAGMLSNKSGIVFIHVGSGKDKLDKLHEVINSSSIPITQFLPTHINRNQSLLKAGFEWVKKGGYIDFTASANDSFIDPDEIDAAEAVAKALDAGIDVNRISISSDGNASLPVFDKAGELIGLEVGSVSSLQHTLTKMISKFHIPMELALGCITSNPASMLKLTKGRLSADADADLLVMDESNFQIKHVFASGKHLLNNGRLNFQPNFE